MTLERKIMFSFTLRLRRSKYRYFRRTSSRTSLEVVTSNGSCLYTFPKISTSCASSSIVPVGIFGLYVSSSRCCTSPATEIHCSFVIPSSNVVSRITTCITPYMSRKSTKDTPPWSRMFSTHPASLISFPTRSSDTCAIVMSL